MVLLTDLTIPPSFDQAKKNEINKIWRKQIGELEKINPRKDPMNELIDGKKSSNHDSIYEKSITNSSHVFTNLEFRIYEYLS